MIIKNYTLGMGGSVSIIEGVEDVTVHLNTFKGKNTGQVTPHTPNSWIYQDDVADDQDVRFIDFKKDGIYHRLYVTNFAYVCNDEGKTIETVKVQQ